jgi:hypothetical protein
LAQILTAVHKNFQELRAEVKTLGLLPPVELLAVRAEIWLEMDVLKSEITHTREDSRMTTVWGTLTIGSVPVQVSATQLRCCKLSFQVAPGDSGSVKVGGPGLTPDTTTPGTYLDSTGNVNKDGSAQAGGSWSVESYQDSNTINAAGYHVHGTHAGDLVFYEYHQN